MDTLTAGRVIAAMDDFPFSLEDWFRDGGLKVSKEAAAHVLGKDPLLQETPVEGILEHLLSARCRSEMESSVRWVKDPSPSDPTLGFDAGDKRIEGRCRIEPKRVRVTLVRGGKQRCRETVILDWAPRIYTLEPFMGSPANGDGLDAARRLLLILYYETLYRNA